MKPYLVFKVPSLHIMMLLLLLFIGTGFLRFLEILGQLGDGSHLSSEVHAHVAAEGTTRGLSAACILLPAGTV